MFSFFGLVSHPASSIPRQVRPRPASAHQHGERSAPSSEPSASRKSRPNNDAQFRREVMRPSRRTFPLGEENTDLDTGGKWTSGRRCAGDIQGRDWRHPTGIRSAGGTPGVMNNSSSCGRSPSSSYKQAIPNASGAAGFSGRGGPGISPSVVRQGPCEPSRLRGGVAGCSPAATAGRPYMGREEREIEILKENTALRYVIIR